MPSTKEKFDAAVDIVRSLPKEGALTPADDVRLKFYGYFKQATEGKCETAQPWMVDVVNRAKWDAWNKYGDMSKEDAMTHYTEELAQLMAASSLDGADDALKAKIENFLAMIKK